MILYVNGDSHTAAAEAVNPHCFAEDDGNLYLLGRHPHPANLAVSWGQQLAKLMNAELYCDAESAASNARIMRTTRDWIRKNYNRLDRTVMVIQWSTWEREEWLIGNEYFQVNSSGIDDIPAAYQQKYKEFVADIDWDTKTREWHETIWQFHLELESAGIKHIFFNGNNDFAKITDRKEWGISYVEPYDPDSTFNAVISKKCDTVSPTSWHYGPDGHRVWAQYLTKYIVTNKIV